MAGSVESRLRVTRQQILAFRRRVGALDERMPMGSKSLRRAAWAGLQDSMPRAALLSLHARVDGVEPSTWEDPSLAQLWGPRYSTYVVAEARLRAVLAREASRRRQEPASGRAHRRAVARPPRRQADDGPRGCGARSASATRSGTPRRRARSPSAGKARVRRRSGRSTLPRSTRPTRAASSLDATSTSSGRRRLTGSPAGQGSRDASAADAFALARRIAAAGPIAARRRVAARRRRAGDSRRRDGSPRPRACCRAAMPTSCSTEQSGSFSSRATDQRQRLWTPRVWPGALLVEGEIRGTWRRAHHTVRIDAWARLSRGTRDAIEAEASALPLPGVDRPIEVVWNT